jgi:hypothetical protein
MKETPPVMDIHGWEADYIRSFSASTNFDLGLASASTVLPAFFGNVLVAISKIYPNAKIMRLGEWFALSPYLILLRCSSPFP